MASKQPKRSHTYINEALHTDKDPQNHYESIKQDPTQHGAVSQRKYSAIRSRTVLPQKSNIKKKKCQCPPWWAWVFFIQLLGTLAILIFMLISDQESADDVNPMYVPPKPGPGGRVKIADSVEQMMPAVLKGPNRAQSFCLPYGRSSTYSSSILVTPVRTFKQPPTVNSYTKCQIACQGSDQDHILPSGDTCTCGSFDGISGLCFLSAVDFDNSAHLFSNQDSRIDTFYYYGYCYSTLSPGCSRRVQKWHNRRPPLCLQTEHYLQPATLSDCIDGCYLLYMSSNNAMRCYGFTYSEEPQLCVFIVSPCEHAQLELAPGTDFYSYGDYAGDSCSSCSDSYLPGAIGMAGYTGSSQGRRSYSDSGCASACNSYLRTYGMMCYGFDYNPSTKYCHYMTRRDYTTTPKATTRNHRRHVTCYGCDRFAEYISTLDTQLLGLDELPVSSSSLSNCAGICYRTSVNVTACYGFAYSSVRRQCTIFRKFDQDVGQVGKTRGTDVFRRIFTCGSSDACKETYTKTTNSAAAGGILQPKDINTVPRCEDRCYANVIATKLECYGFDFNRATSQCYVIIDRDYEQTVRTDGNVDNYKRDKKCPLPY